ncbi:MAG: thioredoxin [Bacteroidetes bacterium]|nr:MAG: thioredoxin [Bacteroidota bacterium]
MAGLFSTNAYCLDDETEEIEAAVANNTPNEEKKAVKLTDANFKETISEGVTLVDFWATWCGPCRRQGPIVEEIAAELGSQATIGKLDVDHNKTISSEYYIRTIPTILIFKDGEVQERLVGLQTKESLVRIVKRYL